MLALPDTGQVAIEQKQQLKLLVACKGGKFLVLRYVLSLSIRYFTMTRYEFRDHLK